VAVICTAFCDDDDNVGASEDNEAAAYYCGTENNNFLVVQLPSVWYVLASAVEWCGFTVDLQWQ